MYTRSAGDNDKGKTRNTVSGVNVKGYPSAVRALVVDLEKAGLSNVVADYRYVNIADAM